MKTFLPVVVSLGALVVCGCSTPARAPSQLGSLPLETARSVASAPASTPLEGNFNPRPLIETAPADTKVIYGRDSLDDFLFANDITPSDSDTVVIRRSSDRQLAFIFYRGPKIVRTYFADQKENALLLTDTGASFHFETYSTAEGGGMKTWSDMKIRSLENGELKFEVALRVRLDAWHIPYSTTDSKWTFRLKRITAPQRKQAPV